ncbi:MAG: TonB-dependent receptor, partial [Bacteroidota bacterium]
MYTAFLRGVALAALTLLAGAPIAAQSVTGRVLSAQTDAALAGVTLLVDGTTVGTMTDPDGRFSLDFPDGAETITASFVGYQTETVAATPGDNVTIRLRVATTDLQPVVVSASRSARARAEVPVAVATISAADLQATRPNLLAEALNRTTGVYMVDLGNEQHAMAIRQPFSYKPLFLYLEDGVPIRPAGLFNHNALIEVNQGGVEQIEVVRGPGSALYGAGAIGGAVNFVTQTPSAADPIATSARGGSYGYGRVDASGAARSGNLGLFAAGYVAGQRDGLREHSDYDKVSLTARADLDLDPRTRLTLTGTYNDLVTDTDGSLDSLNFFSDGFTSLQTFTNRDVQAGRAALRLDRQWAGGQRSSVTAFGRTNSVAQNPHYRLRIDSDDPSQATGEVNDNAFTSLGVQAQHEAALGPVRLLAGATVDRSPASYIATRTEVTRDPDTGVFTSFTDTGELMTDYDVVLLNTAGFVQAEVQALRDLRIVGSLRADRVGYDFDNALPPGSFSGVVDTTNSYARITPRLGVIWAPTPERGLYANASQGFLPPEAGEL